MAILKWWRERQRRQHSDSAALAMMVWLTYNGGGPKPMVSLQRWCNRQLGRRMFDEKPGE